MSRTGSRTLVALCGLAVFCLSPAARAEEQPVPSVRAKAVPRSAASKRVRRPGRAKAAAARSKPAGDSLIAPATASAPVGDDASRPSGAGRDAWSISPKWSASNGGSSAAYGTRALLNELQTNPAETTGYGAGAELNLHF